MAMKEKREGKQQRSEQDLEMMAVPIYLSVKAEVDAGVFEVAGYLLVWKQFCLRLRFFFALMDEQVDKFPFNSYQPYARLHCIFSPWDGKERFLSLILIPHAQ